MGQLVHIYFIYIIIVVTHKKEKHMALCRGTGKATASMARQPRPSSRHPQSRATGPRDGPGVTADLHFQRTGPSSYVSTIFST